MRTRFNRSSEIKEVQIQAVLESSVNMFACGVGAPPELLRRRPHGPMGTYSMVPKIVVLAEDVLVLIAEKPVDTWQQASPSAKRGLDRHRLAFIKRTSSKYVPC